MVRKIVSSLVSIVMFIALLTSCTKSSNQYTDVIPSDSESVFSIDLKSLFLKTGVTREDIGVLKDKFLTAVSSGLSETSSTQIEKILTNPKESGVDFESPLYLFFNNNMSYTSILCRIDNSDKLTATLDVLKQEKVYSTIEESSGYKYFIMNNNVIVAFNQTALLITSIQTSQEQGLATVNKWMTQPEKERLAETKLYEKMSDAKGDIRFISSAASFYKLYGKNFNMNFLSGSDINLNDLFVYGGLSFDAGKIALKMNSYSDNKETANLLSQQEAITRDIKGEFNKYIPEKSLAIFSMGLNGDQLFDFIESNKATLNNIPSDDLSLVKDVINSFDGDITFAITDLNTFGQPNYLLYAKVNNNNLLNEIYKNQAKLTSANISFKQLSDNTYYINSQGIKIYMGISNGVLYASGSNGIFANPFVKLSPSVANAPFAQKMDGNKGYFAINVSEILNLSIVKLFTGFGGSQVKTYYDMASKIDYVNYLNTHDNATDINIVLKDNTTNSLAQIVEYAKLFLAFM